MHLKETIAPLHEHYSTVESLELALDYTVFPFLRRIVDVPTEVIIADHDYITLWDLETAAFNAIPTPKKKLFVVPDTAHMTLYSDKSALDLAAEECTDWLSTYLHASVPVLA